MSAPTAKASCPQDDTIAAFADAQLGPDQRAAVLAHISECAACHALFGELARVGAIEVASTITDVSRASSPAAEGPAPAPLTPGDRLDGYVLQRRLDAGAMGEVWLAQDSELGRPVAVKVLKGGTETRMADSAGLLRREARSLAQLSHPNVVTVHGVAEVRGRDYIAMEYVAGVTLRRWLTRGAPTLNARLDVMIQAGRGLAAAHRAGIVHRDFKPSNVLVGDDGRVRVGDFGLARLRQHDPAAAASPEGSSGRVTAYTAIAGTPVYMAPEQLAGGPATDAGDQYSFAVSLYEAVYGVRPFAGANVSELSRAIVKGAPQPPPERVRVPGWLRAIILRGLHAKPEARFPSMDALVDALEAGRRRRRRLAVAAAMLAVAGATVAIAVPVALNSAGIAASPCGGEDALADKVWNRGRAVAIGQHLEAAVGKFGAEQWARAAPLVDDYARKWVIMRKDTCAATHVRHAQSDSLHDKRVYCLDRRLAQLDSVAGTIGAVADAKSAARVLELAAGLPPLAPCADSKWLSEAPLPPPEQRVAVEEAFRALDAARALATQGKHKDALAAYRALTPRAEQLGFAPLVADLAFEIAWMADRVGEFDVAAAEYERATRLAGQLGRTDRVFESEVRAMRMEGWQEKYDRAFGRAASLAGIALLSPDKQHPTMFHENLGAVYGWQGKYKESIAEYRRALALLPADVDTGVREASTREGLGLSLMRLGDHEASQPELERALALRVERYGERHPFVATTYTNLGNLAYFRGRYTDARDLWGKALAIQESLSPSGSDPDIAITLGNVAIAQQALGDLEGSLKSFDRALEMRIKFFGPEHAEVARNLSNKSTLLGQMGRYDEAEALARQSIAMREKHKGKDAADLERQYLNLGQIMLMRAKGTGGAVARTASAAALRVFEDALALALAHLTPGHEMVGKIYLERSRAELVLGRIEAARADADKAFPILAKAFAEGSIDRVIALTARAEAELAGGDAAEAVELLAPVVKEDRAHALHQAYAAFALARAQRAAGKGEDLALATGKQALAFFAQAPELEAKTQAKAVRAWMGVRAPE